MQISKILYNIHKLVKVVYDKTDYEDTIFVSENLWINKSLFIWI